MTGGGIGGKPPPAGGPGGVGKTTKEQKQAREDIKVRS